MISRRRLIQSMVSLPAGASLTLPASARVSFATTTPSLSVKAFGAIGDGRSHPVQNWVPSRYPNLAAIQADYPDVRSLADEIDFAAINKAVRAAAEQGIAVVLPPGTYRAWVYVKHGGVRLVGAGAAACCIRLPDGATHRLIGENGEPLEGTPCVIEAGTIGDGNHARPLTGFSIVGVTLDGNRVNTRPPADTTGDVFGWGLAFTNFSDARYSDLVAVDCHAGGIGTFITSNRHIGQARIRDCGQALEHPGFDVNSSGAGRWTVTVERCPYGVRLLDNVEGCMLDVRIIDAVFAGLVCDNQLRNSSRDNLVKAFIQGGCQNAGAQIGNGCTDSTYRLRVEGVDGIAVNSIGSARQFRGESNNRFVVYTSGNAGQSAVIGGEHGEWRIESQNDARGARAGALFAVDVTGSSNAISTVIADDGIRRLRGLIFRPTAKGNRASYTVRGKLLESVNNQGQNNVARPLR